LNSFIEKLRRQICCFGIRKYPFQSDPAEYPLEKGDGMIPNPDLMARSAVLLFKKGFQVVRGGIGGIELYQGRLD
jgi:hypothetical protein